MKNFYLFTVLLFLFQYGALCQNIFELKPSQSMSITGLGPGQDAAINPYSGKNSLVIIENISKNSFAIRIQNNGKIINEISIDSREIKNVKLLKGDSLYLDSILKSKAKITFRELTEKTGKNYSEKVATLDKTIETLYDVISGEKGEARNWQLFRYLFHPDAKLIPSGKNKEGIYTARFMTAEDYISQSGSWLVENGFFEKEIHRVTETFGNITHVFSTYEAFWSEPDTKPFMRGINSIQFLNDGQRWWILNIYWTQEMEETPIPETYLPKIKTDRL